MVSVIKNYAKHFVVTNGSSSNFLFSQSKTNNGLLAIKFVFYKKVSNNIS